MSDKEIISKDTKTEENGKEQTYLILQQIRFIHLNKKEKERKNCRQMRIRLLSCHEGASHMEIDYIK